MITALLTFALINLCSLLLWNITLMSRRDSVFIFALHQPCAHICSIFEFSAAPFYSDRVS